MFNHEFNFERDHSVLPTDLYIYTRYEDHTMIYDSYIPVRYTDVRGSHSIVVTQG